MNTTNSQSTTFSECPYCGKPLAAQYNTFAGKKMFCGYELCYCEGARKEREREKEEREIEKRQREHEAKLKRYHAAGIKPRFMAATYPESDSLMERVRRGESIYITGNVGCGKTYYASALAKYAIDLGRKVRVIDMPRFLSALKATFNGDMSEDDLYYEYERCDLLVIDDLGKEAPTDWVLMHLFRLINERYEQMKPVIITTQFSKKDLAQRLAKNGDKETAAAIISRLTDMCTTFRMSRPDRRLEKARNEAKHATRDFGPINEGTDY